ncbi:MAG: AAA family ATPase [Gammaproteobacteria bacterium]|nr:AAA family ATPase [Gammaproteobacteria bacterium]
MDPLHNPFSPGAGSPPPELAGRSRILEQARVTLGRIKAGRPERSQLLIGLRGVGKTVLLNKIREMAEEMGYRPVFIEAHENKPLAALLLPPLRQLLISLDRMATVSEKAKRGLRVLKSFFNGVKLKYQDIEIGIDIDPEEGTADSGDLEADLSALFLALGEAAMDRGTAIALIVDELQYLSEEELSALIMAMHQISQRQLPVVLIGAGLPQLVALAGRAKSYAERLFQFPELGPLQPEDAAAALQEPVMQENVRFTDEALQEVIVQTQGYPYFLQEWGYQSWNIADQSPIEIGDVRQATDESIRRLDTNFFRVRFDRLTPREKEYLRALAELGDGPHRSGDVAEQLGVKVQSVAPVRNSLIKKGMIYSPSHGDTAFTVPLFGDFMKRIMPASNPRNTPV